MGKLTYVITYIIKDGENEYSSELLIELEDVKGKTIKEELDKKLDNYFSDFFGSETKKEEGYYCAFLRNVSVQKIEEVSKDDFNILKKYLQEI